MHVTIWKFVSNNSREYHHMIWNGATTTHIFPFTHNNWSQVNIENKKIIGYQQRLSNMHLHLS